MFYATTDRKPDHQHAVCQSSIVPIPVIQLWTIHTCSAGLFLIRRWFIVNWATATYLNFVTHTRIHTQQPKTSSSNPEQASPPRLKAHALLVVPRAYDLAIGRYVFIESHTLRTVFHVCKRKGSCWCCVEKSPQDPYSGWFQLKVLRNTGQLIANPLRYSPQTHVDTVAPPTPPYVDQVPVSLWAQHSSDTESSINETELLTSIHRAISSVSEKEAGLAPITDALLKQDVIVPTTSPYNAPANTVEKPNKSEWRFTQDLREIPDWIIPLPPMVPDVPSILTAIPAKDAFFTIVDLTSVFFSIYHPDTRPIFAFTFKGRQFTFYW